jgi:hypothetical protein
MLIDAHGVQLTRLSKTGYKKTLDETDNWYYSFSATGSPVPLLILVFVMPRKA